MHSPKTTLMTAPTDTYFDLAQALDRCCDDPEFLAEMIDLLGTTVTTQLAAIETAIRARNPQEIGHASHALKGAVASMTLATPYELARALESLGKSCTCDGAEALFAALEISLDQLLLETRTWAARHRATPI